MFFSIAIAFSVFKDFDLLQTQYLIVIYMMGPKQKLSFTIYSITAVLIGDFKRSPIKNWLCCFLLSFCGLSILSLSSIMKGSLIVITFVFLTFSVVFYFHICFLKIGCVVFYRPGRLLTFLFSISYFSVWARLQCRWCRRAWLCKRRPHRGLSLHRWELLMQFPKILIIERATKQ